MTEYCQIELTKGKIARVGPEDWEELSRFNWHARKAGKKFYAARTGPRSEGKKTIHMHRVVVGNPSSDFEVDHIHGDTLDNRRDQLRVCTVSENRQNSPRRCHNLSGYKGVQKVAGSNLWQATIKAFGKKYYLGCFPTREEAFEAYSRAASFLHGEFARTQ